MPKAKTFPSPEDGLRSLVNRAPQAEAFAERFMDRIRPHLEWLYLFRRRCATMAVVFVSAWMFVHVVFGTNGTAAYSQKKTEFHSLQKEIDSLQKENQDYSKRIDSLNTDPKMIEKEAREQLHYAKPGEVIYISPAPAQSTTPPATHSALK